MSAASLLAYLLHGTLAATALVAVVLILRRPVRRRLGAEAALALWLAPALAAVLPATGLGLVPVIGASPLSAAEAPREPLAVRVQADAPPARAPSPPVASPASLDWRGLLVGAWFLGAGASLSASILRTRTWRRTLLAEAVPIDPRLAREADQVFAETRVRPTLVVSHAAAAPQVTGLLRPLVAVPTGLHTQDPATRRLALTHEATHLARGDLWRIAACEALLGLHWFNPALRVAARAFRTDIEAACDARVLRGGARPSDYAETLLRAARGVTAPTPALTLTHALHERIDAMRHPASPAARLLGTTAITALATLAAATAQVQDEKEEREVVVERSTIRTGETPENAEVRFEQETRSDGTRRVHFGEGGESFRIGGADADLILLSDPFSDLVPPAPETPEADAEPPAPPVPPHRFGERRAVREITLRLPEGTDLGDLRLEADRVTMEDLPDGGQQITLVIPTDETMDALEDAVERTVETRGVRILRKINRREETTADFAFEMDRFETEMETFGAEMDRFGARMGAFGEEMGAWGQRMGEVGGAVGRLAAACEDHKARTDAPTVLTERVGEDAIKAVCASGGGARYQSGELTRFVRRHPDLTRAERRAFLRNRDAESTVSVSR